MSDLAELVALAGLRRAWCGYCGGWRLAAKRCLTCGDCVYDLPPDEAGDEDECALDDDGHTTVEWEHWPEGDVLWIRPCGLAGVLLRPEQLRRLRVILAARDDAPQPGG